MSEYGFESHEGTKQVTDGCSVSHLMEVDMKQALLLVLVVACMAGCSSPFALEVGDPSEYARVMGIMHPKAFPYWLCDSTFAWSQREDVRIDQVPDTSAVPDYGFSMDHAVRMTWTKEGTDAQSMLHIGQSLARLSQMYASKTGGVDRWTVLTGGLNPRYVYLLPEMK